MPRSWGHFPASTYWWMYTVCTASHFAKMVSGVRWPGHPLMGSQQAINAPSDAYCTLNRKSKLNLSTPILLVGATQLSEYARFYQHTRSLVFQGSGMKYVSFSIILNVFSQKKIKNWVFFTEENKKKSLDILKHNFMSWFVLCFITFAGTEYLII